MPTFHAGSSLEHRSDARFHDMLDDFSCELFADLRKAPQSLLSEWNTFASECPSVHLEQTIEWGEVRRLDGWQPKLLLVRHKGVIGGGALLMERRLNRFTNIGYVSRGPLISHPSKAIAKVVTRHIVRALKETANAQRLVYLVVDPPYHAGTLPAEMALAGFSPHPPWLPPAGLMNGTILIDLKMPEEELERRLRRTLRQNIRQAQRGGVTIREGDESDIDLLWKLMLDLCVRRCVRPNVSDIEVMRTLWRKLREVQKVRVDIAEINETPVAALMTVFVGDWAIPWRVGWSGTRRKLHPEKLLYWSAIRAARKRGCLVFDFNWIDTREVAAIQRGEELKATENSGITFFKMGFGGKVVSLPQTMDYVPNRIVRTGMRWSRTHPSTALILKRLASRML